MAPELTKQILNLRQGDHLCLFYEKDPAEQMPALIPFIQEGLARNEQFIYIADDHTVEELGAHLLESGIDVPLEIERGRLKLWTRKEWRQPGELSSETKLAQVRQLIDGALRDGFAGIRLAVEMTWTLGPEIDSKKLEHWEATINTIFVPGFPGRIICQYNRSRLAPDALLAGLHTHPLAILGDEICPNPFYQAPLILEGLENGNGHSNGKNNSAAARARVEWMVIQLKRARTAEKQREELLSHQIATAEQNKAEERLREMEQRFQGILDNSATLIYLKDVEGRYLQINRWYERIFHITQQEIVGKTDADLFSDPIAEQFQTNDRKVIETGRPVEIEEVAPHEDGLHNYISIKFPLFKPDGSIAGIAGISTDITERKQAGETSRRLAAIVESSDDAIISKDLNGIITSWNRSAERMFGYKADEVVGRSITILIPPERADEEPGILGRIRRGERIDHYDTIRRRKDGSLLEISITVSPIRDDSGKIIGASKIARDVSDRKRAERQQIALYELVAAVNRLQSLEDIFNAALHAIRRCQNADRAAILLCDDAGVMRFKVWDVLSESYRKAVEGHSPWRSDDPDPEPVCIDDVLLAPLDGRLRAVVEREGIRSLVFIPLTYERRLLGKFMVYYNTPHRFTQDEIRPAQTIASQLVFAMVRHTAGEALERLVNERTASLREAIAQMEEFSYSVSHDLRAPVRAMQGYAKAVMEDYGDRLDKQGHEYLERIVSSSSRMDRLIQDILIYSRVARGDLRLQNISLDKLVRDIVQQYPLMQPPHAELMVAVPLHQVYGHEPSLTQAISNLLSNAVKFVTAGVMPKVRVWTERRDGEVRLWIRDNGIGIKPEFQHRLFGMFERMHPEKNYEGTGIGLAIVRKAVERMGGSVGVESSGSDGSRFWIQLPAAKTT